MRTMRVGLFCAAALMAVAAEAQEDAGPGVPAFQEGDVISLEQVEKLRAYLPPEFWANRDFFFYEGMKLEIGPFHRDYSPSSTYDTATQQFAGQAKRLVTIHRDDRVYHPGCDGVLGELGDEVR